MTKEDLDLLAKAISVEELKEQHIARMKTLVRRQARRGAVDPILEGLTVAMLSDDDRRILVECHRIRAAARWIPKIYSYNSQVWLEYMGEQP
jgi:hypothetical protein